MDLPYNYVYDATFTGSSLDLSVKEAGEPQMRALYRLSAALMPQSVALSDTYWEAHRRLERERRLDHSADACPARRGMPVRIWEPKAGWTEEKVKVVAR